MNLKSHFLLQILIITLLTGIHPATAQQVHTFVETDSLKVGDIFQLTVVIEGEYELLSYPGEADFEDELDYLSGNRYRTDSNRDSLVYQLQFFGTEDVTISGKPIHLAVENGDSTLYTTPVPLFFKSVLAEGDEEFRPLKPIFQFARSLLPWIIGIIILVVTGYLIFRWWVKYRRRAEKSGIEYSPVPFSDPIEQLKEELASLPDTGKLRSFQDFEQYYIKLGDAIRRYLKRVHAIPALEMTTSEITAALKKEFVSSNVITVTRKVLNSADMVKFAHFEPTPDQADSTFQKALEFTASASESDLEKIQALREEHEHAETEKIEQLDPQQE